MTDDEMRTRRSWPVSATPYRPTGWPAVRCDAPADDPGHDRLQRFHGGLHRVRTGVLVGVPMRYLSTIAVVGLLIGITIGAVGQHYGLDRAELLTALLAGGVLAIAVRRTKGRPR